MRRAYTAVCAILTLLLTVTAAIAVPIFWRGFYYYHIDALELPERTGYERETIEGAYDEVVDYLVYGRPFGRGELAYSQEGQSHFEDCRGLFRLDFRIMGLSAAGLAILALVRKALPEREGGEHLPVYWAAVICLTAVALLGFWGIISFDTLFVAFHRLFFPGKSNWIFDPKRDEIIKVLPQTFFMNCAMLIDGIILCANIIYLVIDARRRKGPGMKYKKNNSK